LDRIEKRRILMLLKIQRLKVRQELSDEAFPDQEVVSEGSDNDLNFQEVEECLMDLEES
jgi:hypothetical protein